MLEAYQLTWGARAGEHWRFNQGWPHGGHSGALRGPRPHQISVHGVFWRGHHRIGGREGAKQSKRLIMIVHAIHSTDGHPILLKLNGHLINMLEKGKETHSEPV